MKKTIFINSILVATFAILATAGNALAITTEEARQMLSTGLNPDGTQATATQLQDANRIYYGTFYNFQPSVTGSTNNQIDTGSSAGQTSSARCTGNTTTDFAAAQACADLAQSQGTALGYRMSCRVNVNFLPAPNPGTGLSYYLDPTCTVNGESGHSAVLLSGYQTGPTTSSNPNTHPSDTNPSWSSLRISTNTSSASSGNSSSGSSYTGQSSSSLSSGSGVSSVIGNIQNQVNQALSALNSISSSYSYTSYSGATSGVSTGSSSGSSSAPANNSQACGINSDLRLGDSGTAVQNMTKELVKEGLLSSQKNVFDQEVFAAVVSYQERYAAFILSPVGLSRGSGFVGPSTRTFMNSRITCSSSSSGSGSNSSAGGTSTNAQSLQNQINELQNLVNSLIARLNGSTAGTGSTNTGSISVPATFSPSQNIAGPVSLRYLKVTSKSRSWIAWREIEIYDTNGQKISPASATVSCDWCNYPQPNGSSGAQGVYDGNVSTVWNAGETAPGCDWNFLNLTLDACLDANASASVMARNGWIAIDFGQAKNVSKIRLLSENTPNPAKATHIISTSQNGSQYTDIAAFGGSVPSNTWLEVTVQ